MMVVLAIIATVTAVALTSQSSFNRSLVLVNTAYDIALTLRSAENFGMGSRATGVVANAGYGIHFKVGTPNSFIMFADTFPPVDYSCTRPDCKPGDHVYTGNDAIVQTYTLGNGITVSNFCAYSDSWHCASTGTRDLNSLDVVFMRPNPDAYILANTSPYTPYTATCLTISSNKGGSRFISVAVSGQIIADIPACPPL
ncbi:MAG: hypothetical protein Q8L52_03355 [bacterium]|nr:hypothetical protein [bacterium]